MIDSNTCGSLIKQIHDSLEKQANNTMRPHDITMAQFGVLLALYGAESGFMTLKELEAAIHVAQSTMAGIVSRLEQKKMLYAMGDPQDKRVKRVQITDMGRACCREAKVSMAQAEETILSGLTDAERSIFHTLLLKVRDNLQ